METRKDGASEEHGPVPEALSEVEVGRKAGTTDQAKVGLTLSLKPITEEESAEEKIRKQLRSRGKFKSFPSNLSVILGLRGLSLGRENGATGASPPLHYTRYRLRGSAEQRLAGSRPMPNVSRQSAGIMCLELDSRGELFASGAEDGRVSILRSSSVAHAAKASEPRTGAEALLVLPTRSGPIRSVRWNPRDENEIAVACGYTRQVQIYDLSRWTEGKPPTRTLTAASSTSRLRPNTTAMAAASANASAPVHNGIVHVRHLEGMGRYVIAGGTAGGEVLLWDTRCKIRSDPRGIYDGTGAGFGHPWACRRDNPQASGLVASLGQMFKRKEDLRTKCALRRGTSAIVSILECGTSAGILHACNARGEVVSWDLGQRKNSGFVSSAFGAGGGGGDYFHPLNDKCGPVLLQDAVTEHMRGVNESRGGSLFETEAKDLWLTSRLVGVAPDPLDSRRFVFTLSSGVSGLARVSDQDLRVTKIFADLSDRDPEMEERLKQHQYDWQALPASVRNDPRVSRIHEQRGSNWLSSGEIDGRPRAADVVGAQFAMKGDCVCGLDPESGNDVMKIFDASTRNPAAHERHRWSVSMEGARPTCFAAHPYTDDIYCGTRAGAYVLLGLAGASD